MKQFNKEEQIKFWKGNTQTFKGEIISKIVLGLSKKYVGEKVIDIGAGSGALLENFLRIFKNNKIIALDLVPKNSKVIQGDCTNLKYPNESFDTCFAMDVIEHLNDNDLKKCLNEANRILKNGGYGIFTTMNDEDLKSSEVTCPECGVKFHNRGHCQVFTDSIIKKLFEKRGFKLVKLKKINLGFLARFGILARIFYLFKLEKLDRFKFLIRDLFLVVKKIRNI